MSRFLITNRYIINESILPEHERDVSIEALNNERVARDGREEAGLHTRYGFINPKTNLLKFKGDPNDIISLYPHRENDDADFSVSKDVRFGSSALFSALHEAMCAETGGDLLIYVHGFHSDLDKAIKTTGILEDRFLKVGSPVRHILLFTWPAQNKKIKYRNDARDCIISGEALARNILKLQTFFNTWFQSGENKTCGRKIHLLAHSMGARVVEHAMAYLQKQSYGILVQTIFQEVILVAADVDDYALEIERPMSFLSQIAERIHSYNHKKDIALEVSKKTKNAYPRLGQKGIRNFANLPTNVVLVDVTGVKEETKWIDDIINHWYYHTAPDVVADIIEVFKGRAAIDIAETTGFRKKWPDKPNLYWLAGENI
jgi:esterase/lipase superfamily enzyme